MVPRQGNLIEMGPINQLCVLACLLARSTLICVSFLKLKFSYLILCHHSYSKPYSTHTNQGVTPMQNDWAVRKYVAVGLFSKLIIWIYN